MNKLNTIIKLGVIIIAIAGVSGCATTEKTQRHDNLDYSILRGDGETYSDTESAASGGVVDNEDAHRKAQQALNKRDSNQALYYYVKALEFDATDTKAMLALAKIHSSRENLEPTLLAYRMILEIEPDNVEATEGAGLTLLKINQSKQGKAMLDKANELSPGRPNTLMGLAVYHDLKSEFVKSKQYYLEAVKAAPKSARILNNYAYSRYLAGDWSEAEEIYKKLLRQSPKHRQGILNYALLMARKGETMEALQTFKKVLTEAEAYNELGYIHMMQQDYEKARRLFEMAISASPTYFERASKNLEQLKILISKYTRSGTNKSTKNIEIKN